MIAWPAKPFVYEINSWVWLHMLSRAYNRPITLANVPEEVLNELAALHVDAVWLMGVWERSPAAARSAGNYAREYKPALPDLTPDDIVGSPYAVATYRADERLGGRFGLATFREQLHARGLRLILDYVPNHVAVDHPWVRIHPEFLVLGTPRDIIKRPDSFFHARDATGEIIVVAHGRDPYFPGWIDTAQVNVFHPGLRRAALMTLLDIAGQCDGVRCDMAMLVLNEVFARTWEGYAGDPPQEEFWEAVIPQVKAEDPGFLFMAEVYWELEHVLQRQGFDLTYDKRLYDRISEGDVAGIRHHLLADVDYQKRLVRFIENHDEERAAEALGLKKSRPAAVVTCTLPGAVLLHEGQLSGRRVKLPVQIGRQPYEPVSEELLAFYRTLLAETRAPIYQQGEWRLFDVRPPGETDENHADRLLAYGWRNTDDDYRLVVANLTPDRAHGLVDLSAWSALAASDWCLVDVLNGGSSRHAGAEMNGAGLPVELDAYGAHIFRFEREGV